MQTDRSKARQAEKPNSVYFNANMIGPLSPVYVCWLDVMGTRNALLRSLPAAANFVMKLHAAVVESYYSFDSFMCDHDVRLYPVMDGVYITSLARQPLMTLLAGALRRLVGTFLYEETHHHRFLVRGALAYGPIAHGRDIGKGANWTLDRWPDVPNSVLLGLPLAQAYISEGTAPPFGIAVHESARAFAPEGESPFRFIWWDWHSKCQPALDRTWLIEELEDYFDWHLRHPAMTGYDPDRVHEHQALAREYFAP